MNQRNYKIFAEDILESIEKIEKFIKGMDFNRFTQDEKTKSAALREIEIIGEASKNIPRIIKEKHKKLPWGDMARIRDKITHSYFGINYRIIWRVIKEELPKIKPLIERIIEGEKRRKVI